MKKFLKTLSLVIIMATSNSFANVIVGGAVPNIRAQDVRGKQFDLAAQKGKIVVLEWTNHKCPFVRKQYESSNMQEMQKKYTEKDVVWVSINSSAEGKEGYLADDSEAIKVIEDQNAAQTYFLRDKQGDIGREFRATTTPHMFIINKDGKLAYMGSVDSIPSANVADIAKAENYVAKALDALLAGKEIERPNTTAYGCSVKY